MKAAEKKAIQNYKRVAVIHDWLTGMRGGEVVLEAILELFPGAELFTLLHMPGSCSDFIENRPIHTSFIQRFPWKGKLYRHYLPLFPTAIEEFDFHGFDLVISSSHCVAKSVIVPPDVPHVSFVHSPMRYVWDMYRQYFPGKGVLQKLVIPFFANYLRTWDAASAHRVDDYVSNSAFVGQRIRRFYGRSATVVHPPCLDSAPKPGQIPDPEGNQREDFYLVLSALVPYKRIDLAVRAFNESGRKLVIAGRGPEENRLKSMAASNIQFLGHVDRSGIQELYEKARGLIFPGVEDFGIVPVEAQAAGCPVLALGRGGALETVVDGKTGLFFSQESVESLNDAVNRRETLRFRAADFARNTARFTRDAFQSGMVASIQRAQRTIGRSGSSVKSGRFK
ncbi:MAG TPA: glycosyltransferase family 4 protein [Leptospiraceae bacterium]|nr:glycosyl transferase [Spirochaetaceae bacterium]HBS06656.1 glycosyltransferase family 4 protein [Leptospiraceae bacterium]